MTGFEHRGDNFQKLAPTIFSSGFANPAFFPHYCVFVWGRSALPLLQFLFSFQFFCRSQVIVH
jgi:hypothetical protein